MGAAARKVGFTISGDGIQNLQGRLWPQACTVRKPISGAGKTILISINYMESGKSS